MAKIETASLALGGNTFGWTSDIDDSFAVLDRYCALERPLIDTADAYSDWVDGHQGGESETIIGQWQKSRGARGAVLIATKVGLLPARRGLAPENVRLAVDESLQRLQTSYVDILYAHVDDPGIRLEDAAGAFDREVRDGRARALGLSNFTPARMTEWMQICARDGLIAPTVIQPQYNLLKREPFENQYAPLAREWNLGAFPYYGLASGLLTGKYRTKESIAGGQRTWLLERYLSEGLFDFIGLLVDIAEKYQASPAAVALAWVRRDSVVVAPLASARTAEQLSDLLAGLDLEVSAEDYAALDESSGRLEQERAAARDAARASKKA